MRQVTVLGAGLAGAEAAYHLAERGLDVRLIDMKPGQRSPAHHQGDFAELVCSNSLRSLRPENASGILKIELALLNSMILSVAKACAVPAGSALAVDREAFAENVTKRLKAHPKIQIVEARVERLESLGDGPLIVATGPLTEAALFEDIQNLVGEAQLMFFDAAAPLIEDESIDRSLAFLQDRYATEKSDGAYFNCPMNKESYEAFVEALVAADCAPIPAFEERLLFDGCQPIESLAKKGPDTLRFGPLKPVGLRPPGKAAPYAVVQLRQDNFAGSLWNMVGFQTRLRFPEQERVFRMIPGLQEARFARFGVMHRNSFLKGPSCLKPGYESKQRARLYFAGQITGVEGYLESTASGLAAAILLANDLEGISEKPAWFDRKTVMGSLAHYVAEASAKDYQPMKANGGLFAPMSREELQHFKAMDERPYQGRKGRRRAYGIRALASYGLSKEAIHAAFREASQ